MIKNYLFFAACFFTFTAATANTLNCPQALPTDNPAFCISFKSVAECHCTASGLPKMFCKDMKQIYNRMISIFGTVDRACKYQKDTTPQICIDDWNCYLKGGINSNGQLCSSNGRRCE